MARSIEPWAASPYLQLGLLAEAQGDYATATQRLTQAIDREDRNWQLYYLRSKVEREAGDTAAAQADLRQARRLNPLEQCLRGGRTCG
jgi:Flp pilus assembly protein TadD